MTTTAGGEALDTARAEAAEWDDGRRSLILTGSHARGDAHPESDLDIRIVGDGPSSKVLKRREPFLISISAMSEQDNRKAFTDPSACAEFVPGWQSATILVDPTGVAQSLKDDSERWDWSRIDADAAHAWVAKEITSQAEEIHTLIGDLDQGLRPAAAATVSGIATELPPVLAVQHRVLYSSEKELWDRVAERLGENWGELQSTALGEGSLEEASSAAMQMFVAAARGAESLFDERQRAVVDHAVGLAEERIGGAA